MSLRCPISAAVPARIVWQEIESRLRPIDSAVVVLANTTSSSHGDGPDPESLARSTRAQITEFCAWWIRGHGFEIHATPPAP